MEHLQFIQNLELKKFQPVYYLYGTESFFLDEITDYVEEKILNDAEKSFDLSVLYAKDVNISQLVEVCMRYPMIASHQVVVYKESQSIKDTEWEKLNHYLQNPTRTTLLFIVNKGNLDKRKSFSKTLTKYATVFFAEELKESKVPDWIKSYVKSQKQDITHDAAILLAEHLGNNIGAVVNEINKILINAQTKITVKEIEKYVGIHKDYNVFELSKCFGFRQRSRAFKIVEGLMSNEKQSPYILVIANIFSYFTKVYNLSLQGARTAQDVQRVIGVPAFYADEYLSALKNYNTTKLERILQLINKYDLMHKGVNNDSYKSKDLLMELTAKIFLM